MIKALKYIFLRFYILDIPDVVWLLLGMTLVFLVLWQQWREKRWMRWLTAAALLCAIAAILAATVAGRTGGASVRVNLIPFHSYREVRAGGSAEIYRSNFMNAALFFPAGLLATVLLPRKWKRWQRLLLVAVVLTGLSIGLEYVQYALAMGKCEIDDVIHNSVGALAGCLAVAVLSPVAGVIRQRLIPVAWSYACRLWRCLKSRIRN